MRKRETREIVRVKGEREKDNEWQSWALSVFFNFFNNEEWFFCIF